MTYLYQIQLQPNDDQVTRDLAIQAWLSALVDAINGSGGGGGVTSLVAGTGITLNPTSGVGAVTVTATGGLPSIAAYSALSNNTNASAVPTVVQAFLLGTPGVADSGIATQFTQSVAGYEQHLIQNTSAVANASADFVANNNLGTASTYYADFGINSSGYTGSGSLNLPSASYLTATSGDLVLGTTTSNAIHFVVNNGATDAAIISSSGQFQFANWFGNYQSIATAGGTTVLTNASPYWTSFTGTLNQTCQLPVTTLLGTSYNIDNNSSGVVTITASGGATVLTLAANTSVFIQNVTLGGTVAASWEYDYFATQIATGKSIAVNNSMTFAAGADGQTFTFPATTATLARVDAANTFVGASTGTSWTLTTPVIAGGLTASGAGTVDFSGSTAAFKSSTGAVTIGPGAISLTGLVTAAGLAAAGALPSGATTAGLIATFPATTYTVTGTNTATAFQAIYHGAPTITNASVGTITDNFSEVWAGPTVVAGSQVQTRAHTLGILDATSAASSVTGGLVVATAFGTAATSVGIGAGNVNAGGLITGGTITSTGLFTASSTSTFTGATTHNNAVSIVGAAATTALTVSNTARTSGVLPYIKWTIPTDTTLTVATEIPGVVGVTGTRQWATGGGTLALQREWFIPGPTYTAAAAMTVTDAFGLYLTPPIQGSNLTITRNHTFGVVDSTSSTTAITGAVVVATALGTAATSVGIGGGNITAGGAILASTSTGRIGYLAGSGVGTAVVQGGTNRTTGVTSNTPTGAITMFSAAGSATATSFVVSCTSIAVGDAVALSISSGATNSYIMMVSAISAGTSFTITFWTSGGTSTDAPVINYTIIKGSSN